MNQGIRNPRLVIVVMVGAMLIIPIFIFMMGGEPSSGGSPGSSGPPPQVTPVTRTTLASVVSNTPHPTITSSFLDRSTPKPVYEQVELALENNHFPALYEEMSPDLRDVFTQNSLLEIEEQVKSDLVGDVIAVEIIEPLTIRTESDFSSKWADAMVHLRRSYG